MTTSKSALTLLDDLISELESTIALSAPIVQPEAAKTEVKEAKKPVNEKQADGEKGEQKKENKKEEKKDNKRGNDKKAAADANVVEELTVNALDLRVGVIRSVTKHETAEKLYCEEIDVGEDAPRAIASGLVPYYTLEEMQNRRLIVVCNLKPRNLVGFKSHGMVLCASKTLEDGTTKVEFVDPPVNAKAGDRIIGQGLVGEAYTASKCDKSKAFELVAADLKVNEDGIAHWKAIPLVTKDGNELCIAPTVRDAFIK